jgi:hypothetical protein
VSLTNNPKEFFQWLETATEGTLFTFISEWHKKGESSEELIKFIEFLREKAPPLSLRDLVYDENAGIGVCKQSPLGRVAKRTSSRLRRTNDRSVLQVHEDHEDDENAEIGVSLHALESELEKIQRVFETFLIFLVLVAASYMYIMFFKLELVCKFCMLSHVTLFLFAAYYFIYYKRFSVK